MVDLKNQKILLKLGMIYDCEKDRQKKRIRIIWGLSKDRV